MRHYFAIVSNTTESRCFHQNVQNGLKSYNSAIDAVNVSAPQRVGQAMDI